MDEEKLEELIEELQEVITELVMEAMAEAFAESMAPGGAMYEEIMAGAIAGAMMWYGMYKPRHYKRGYTLSDRNNIMITAGSPSISGSNLDVSINVENISPHAGYAEGFRMRNGQYRPGADLYAMIPDEVELPWEPSPEQLTDIVAQAVQIVFG